MHLSLGPILYFWPRDTMEQFYQEMINAPVEVIYLGETVCHKRRSFKAAEWIELAKQLSLAGKQTVLSTLALIEAGSELGGVKRLCRNGELLVEANEMGAVQLVNEQQLPFVGGATLNIYNAHTLQHLVGMGLRRWVMPVELSRDTLGDILADSRRLGIAGELETEVFSFGHMPLAYSARCFTARHHNLPKDECQLKCIDYPDGLPMRSQEGEEFFKLNGIQTQSGRIQHLLPHWRSLAELGVDYMRISPQAQHTAAIVAQYHAAIQGEDDADCSVERLVSAPLCDGYWLDQPGMEIIARV
ncbi:U32 family peptidase [Seongchinamella sediminis]|uniref:Ubiquinone biosynthesis protein UbiV n=1 Tax=Seongchinamella sediminis TaxID=2283635 RepID=A0A3L7DWU0_9GAMM|nr:U32 family peptidase [Seongchinamella sediminis]RLQ21060.1 U32 family peptidase [Seongchinamella sediminis]